MNELSPEAVAYLQEVFNEEYEAPAGFEDVVAEIKAWVLNMQALLAQRDSDK